MNKKLDTLLMFGLPVVAAILYVTTMNIIKKMIKGEETTGLIGMGALLLALILFGTVLLIRTAIWQ
ncbi:hypothetical protein P9747_11410 [Paenibacillus macerans]|uniref:hypothetical protein n=1 Tax=Paenibacillus macerans TaxID=44252 RepID=UPI002E21C6D4|nr:hypothetical protein [Paenibacillus macerans]